MHFFFGVLLIIIGSLMAIDEPAEVVSHIANQITAVLLMIAGIKRVNRADSKPMKIGEEPPINVAYKMIAFVVVLILFSAVS